MSKQKEIISECKECGKEEVEPHFYFDEMCDTCGAIEMLDKIAEEKYELLNNK